MSAPVFTYTHHALGNLIDRGIDRESVERAILQPDATELDPQFPDRVRAYRALPEHGGRTLRVVYVEAPRLTYRIITLFLDRGRRRRRESQIRSGR